MPFWWHSKVGLEWLAGKSLKPDLSVNILSISKLVNLSIVLLRRHCVLLNKQLRSLLLKLLINNKYVWRKIRLQPVPGIKRRRSMYACLLAMLGCVCVYT